MEENRESHTTLAAGHQHNRILHSEWTVQTYTAYLQSHETLLVLSEVSWVCLFRTVLHRRPRPSPRTDVFLPHLYLHGRDWENNWLEIHKASEADVGSLKNLELRGVKLRPMQLVRNQQEDHIICDDIPFSILKPKHSIIQRIYENRHIQS